MSVSNMMAEKRLRKYRKAFSESGWNLQASGSVVAEDIDNFNGPAFYLCDYETGQLHVVSTRTNIFELIESHNDRNTPDYQDTCNAFGSFYTDICTGRIPLSSEASNILALAVCSYITGTKGYELVNTQGLSNMHYLVIRHLDHSTNMPILRPVPIKGLDYYTPEAIAELVNEVLSFDMQNHPERFKSAEIIPFQVNTRTDL